MYSNYWGKTMDDDSDTEFARQHMGIDPSDPDAWDNYFRRMEKEDARETRKETSRQDIVPTEGQ